MQVGFELLDGEELLGRILPGAHVDEVQNPEGCGGDLGGQKRLDGFHDERPDFQQVFLLQAVLADVGVSEVDVEEIQQLRLQLGDAVVQTLEVLVFGLLAVVAGYLLDQRAFQESVDQDVHGEVVDDDGLDDLHQEFGVLGIGPDPQGLPSTLLVRVAGVGALSRPQGQVDVGDFPRQLVEHGLDDGKYPPPNRLFLLLDVRDQLLQHVVVSAELFEVEGLHADGGEIFGRDSHVLLRQGPSSEGDFEDRRQVADDGLAGVEVVEELRLLDELASLLGGGEAQGDDGLDGVEDGVGVGKLELHVLDVQLVEVEEVVHDDRHPMQHRLDFVGLGRLVQAPRDLHQLLLLFGPLLYFVDPHHLPLALGLLLRPLALLQHFLDHIDFYFLYQGVIGQKDLLHAAGAIFGLQEVSDQGDADGDEVDELGPDIGEGGLQPLQQAADKELRVEGQFEECPHLLELSLFPEGRTEEQSPEEVQQLDLGDVLLVDDRLAEHLVQGLVQVVDDLVAQAGVVDVVDQRLQQLDRTCVDPGVSQVEVDPHAL